jgi:hypothetical protein
MQGNTMSFISRGYKSMRHDYKTMVANLLFKKLGYTNGLVHFPGIDMSLSVPKNRHFADDGIVKDIAQYTKSLRDILVYGNPCNDDFYEVKGTCFNLNLENLGIKTSMIYIVDCGKYSNILIRGHESMHAIWNLGLEDQFLEKLKDEGLSIRPFSDYAGEESIANLGIIVASYNFDKWRFQNNPMIKTMYNELLWECTNEELFRKNVPLPFKSF